jgi:hypothetical protein
LTEVAAAGIFQERLEGSPFPTTKTEPASPPLSAASGIPSYSASRAGPIGKRDNDTTDDWIGRRCRATGPARPGHRRLPGCGRSDLAATHIDLGATSGSLPLSDSGARIIAESVRNALEGVRPEGARLRLAIRFRVNEVSYLVSAETLASFAPRFFILGDAER